MVSTDYIKPGGDGGLEPSSVAKKRGGVVIYALTVFIGAFLLFQVQPLFGKYILPWFGGSPEVWTVCMLFFQVFLLGGYAYAHFIVSHFGNRLQAAVHIVLIVIALAALPITPQADMKPQGAEDPVLGILFLLTVCIGLPYFVLSSTAPLLQKWFSRTEPRTSPYRLYALSNAGSFIALISYPFVVEPALSRRVQTQVWSLGLVVFAFLCICCAVRLWRHPVSDGRDVVEESDTGKAPAISDCLLWLGLPAAASIELLAVTNKICQDVAVIPFLWVLPLSLYLLSFVICFNSEKWYLRRVSIGVFIIALGGVILARMYEEQLSAGLQIWIYSIMLLSCCMVCHGELFRLRPGHRYLTRFYLMIAAGGAVGGVFVAVIAPVVFKAYHELYIGILACCLFVVLADKSPVLSRGRRRWVWVGLMLAVGVTSIFVRGQRGDAYRTVVSNSRNFFGVLTIWESDRDDPARHRYIMQHGTTFHGLQFVEASKHSYPTAYYGRSSGGGLAMRFFPRQNERRIGIVGLGVGTLAAYGEQGDYMRFYEINPDVKCLAETQFTYLKDSRADVDIVLGDARLSMEAEPPQQFDVLILDAFTSDAIPVHLLTKEAFDIYRAHLKPDGVIAIHISTVHLDLQPVLFKLAEHFGFKSVWIKNAENETEGTYSSDWVLLTNNKDFLQLRQIRDAASQPEGDLGRVDLWTDERVNLFEILK